MFIYGPYVRLVWFMVSMTHLPSYEWFHCSKRISFLIFILLNIMSSPLNNETIIIIIVIINSANVVLRAFELIHILFQSNLLFILFAFQKLMLCFVYRNS